MYTQKQEKQVIDDNDFIDDKNYNNLTLIAVVPAVALLIDNGGVGYSTLLGAVVIGIIGGLFAIQEGAAIGARFGKRIGLFGGLIAPVAGVAGGAAIGGAIGYFAYGVGSGYGDAGNSVVLGEFTAFGAIFMGMFGGSLAIQESAKIGTRLGKRIGLLGGLIALVAGVTGGASLGGAIGYFADGVGSGYGGLDNSGVLGEFIAFGFTAFGAILMGAVGGLFGAQGGAAIGTRFGWRVELLGDLIGFAGGVSLGAALWGVMAYLAYGVG